LQAKKVVDNITNINDVAIIVHLYYIEVWDEIVYLLKKITRRLDIYITVNENISENTIEYIKNSIEKICNIKTENRGRDILPFLKVLQIIKEKNYKYICKIHTKKSLHRLDGNLWRKIILHDLLGSDEIVKNTLINFQNNPTIGMVGPKNNILPLVNNINNNEKNIQWLVSQCNIAYDEDSTFIAGSMMWIRCDILQPLYDLCNKNMPIFEDENLQLDGTMAHAIERFLGLLVTNKSYSIETSDASLQTLPTEVLLELSKVVFQQENVIGELTHKTNTQKDTVESKIKEINLFQNILSSQEMKISNQKEELSHCVSVIEQMSQNQEKQKEELEHRTNVIEEMSHNQERSKIELEHRANVIEQMTQNQEKLIKSQEKQKEESELHNQKQKEELEHRANVIKQMAQNQEKQKEELEHRTNVIEQISQSQERNKIELEDRANIINDLTKKLQKIHNTKIYKIMSTLNKDLKN